ncbi:MAG: hypothetical protein DRN61_04485 [Thaumarchaeota archaeon]|nr:MAG: hypothetical protein DRN61_04485 [Nitrososphaerota archaeon]HDD42221.1 orotidine 5'-phosphate decarboxylase [Nitrososphaeria archaeon]
MKGFVNPSPGGKTPAKLWRLAEDKRSRLILALDLCGDLEHEEPILGKCINLLNELKDLAAGVKIGLPLSLSIGFDGVSELLDRFKEDFYMIADFKLSDIPHIIQLTLSAFKRMGFDAAIAHLFQGGLSVVKRDLDLFGVVAMSHPQSKLLQENLRDLVREAAEAEVEGIVVGATRSSLIEEARKLLPEKTILSPGVIAQGASPASALRHGGDFEIVGRAITRSPNPVRSASFIVEAERDVLYR